MCSWKTDKTEVYADFVWYRAQPSWLTGRKMLVSSFVTDATHRRLWSFRKKQLERLGLPKIVASDEMVAVWFYWISWWPGQFWRRLRLHQMPNSTDLAYLRRQYLCKMPSAADYFTERHHVDLVFWRWLCLHRMPNSSDLAYRTGEGDVVFVGYRVRPLCLPKMKVSRVADCWVFYPWTRVQ